MCEYTSQTSEAKDVLQREWPLLRCRLIDLASAIDRLQRAGALEGVGRANELLQTLLDAPDEHRAERMLQELSRPYDPAWRERFAAGEQKID